MEKILIVKPDHIGDYILVRNFLAELRKSERYGNYEITFLGNTRVRELAEYLDSEIINSFVWIDLEKFTQHEWYRHFRTQEIVSERYDVIVNLMFTRFQKVEDLIAAIQAPHKIVVKGTQQERKNAYVEEDLALYNEVIDLSDKKIFEYERFRYSFEKLLGVRLTNMPNLILPHNQNVFSQAKPYVLFFIGSDAEYRKWDRKNYTIVIHHIIATYDVRVVLCGGAAELEDSEYIGQSLQSDMLFNFVGETTLVDMMHLVASSTFVVSNETGLAHMATLMHIPTLVISNGNNYGKFTPYPSFYNMKYFALYPFEEKSYEILVKQFYEASRLDINTISVAQVIKSVDMMSLFCALKQQEKVLKSQLINICQNTFSEKQVKINYQFSYMFSSLYLNILELIESKQKFVLYGYGSFAKTLECMMHDSLVGVIDKGIDIDTQESKPISFIAPEQLKTLQYDKIIITVLGRENEIRGYLIDELKIDADKIITLKVLEGRYIGC
ncbi:MAG: glycosyltransferase family 9 protein [Helicobacteraceae bacterium]|nr:glycosyltransferase family 9 protein [Helicobacteraceae bacterium]